jgi:hypothetical protein
MLWTAEYQILWTESGGAKWAHYNFMHYTSNIPPLCLVVRVPGYRSRGPGFDSRRYQIFREVVGLERGPLSLVSIIEELLGRKSSGSGLENREYSRGDPSRWPRYTPLSAKVGTNFACGLRPRSLHVTYIEVLEWKFRQENSIMWP